MNKITHAIVAAGLALAGTSALAVDLVTNGSFEDAVVSGQWAHQLPTGWTFTGHTPVVFTNTYVGGPAGHLNQGVQLEYHGDTLSQSFSTALDQAYTLSFMVSGYNSKMAPLGVSVGSSTGSYTGTNGVWTTYTLGFTGTGASMTLTFTNTGTPDGSYGLYPHLDNVSVTAVPEPPAMVMMLAGMLAVGFVAARRRV